MPIFKMSKPESVVYFTSRITPDSIIKMYEILNRELKGRVAIKISTGEPGNNHYLHPELIGDIVKKLNGTIVECNTAYSGKRTKIDSHMKAVQDHGFLTIADVDIMDYPNQMKIPVPHPYHLKENYVGKDLENYDSMLVLSHAKMHAIAGYGAALKNIGIGIASSYGKTRIHTAGMSEKFDDYTKTPQNLFLESMVDSIASIIEYVGRENMAYINIANNVSIDCDCFANPHTPEIDDIGIFSSIDPVACDQAFIDSLYQLPDSIGKTHLLERLKERSGEYILDAAERVGLGSRKYRLEIL